MTTNLPCGRSICLSLLVCAWVSACAGSGMSAPAQEQGTAPAPSFAAELPQGQIALSSLRQVSATRAELNGAARTADSGNTIEPGDGRLVIVPGGDEELAWARYSVGSLNIDRPVSIEVDVQVIVPGGDEELVYWVLLSNYSAFRWEARGPFSTPQTLTLNSAELRNRYVSLAGGADSPSMSFAIVTQGNASNNAGDDPLAQPRVEVSAAALNLLDCSTEAYFATTPYYCSPQGVSGGINGGTAGDPIQLKFSHAADPAAGGKNEASGYEVARVEEAEKAASSADLDAAVIGWLDASGAGNSLTYSDPSDNDSFAAPPEPGLRYAYYLRGDSKGGATGQWTRLGTARVGLPGTWATQIVDDAGSVGIYTSICVVDGKPAIAYFDVTNEALKYVYADDETGTSWGAPQTLDTGLGPNGGYCSLTVVDGFPAIAYYSSGLLRYIRAADETGSLWGAAQSLSDVAADAGRHASLQVVDGRPAIACLDETNIDLIYVRANDAQGQSWPLPSVVDGNGSDVGDFARLAIVAGHPAIGYWDRVAHDLMYIRAGDSLGTTWGNPVRVDEPSGNGGGYLSLAVINGNPAMSFRRVSGGHRLFYVRAADAAGDSWNLALELQHEGVYSLGVHTNLLQFKESPLVAFRLSGPGGGLLLRWANDANGATWPSTPVKVEAGNAYGSYNSVTLLNNGSLGCSYHDQTLQVLKFATY